LAFSYVTKPERSGVYIAGGGGGGRCIILWPVNVSPLSCQDGCMYIYE
jgi:hypothetical protein